MRLGLGTGSTAKHFVELLAERVRGGLEVVGVPTSETTRADAQRLGVPLTTLDETPELDMTIDGADEIGPDLTLIKGGGGALLREKIVAAASARMVVIADESKWVETLGRFPLPVEVMPFGLAATRRAVEAARGRGGQPRPGGAPAGQGRPRFRHGRRALDTGRRRSIGSPILNCWPNGYRPSPGSSSTVSLSGSRKPPYSPAQPALASSSGRDRRRSGFTRSYAAMIVRLVARTLGAAAFACLAIAGSAHAQATAPQPSAAAVALAVQILEVKGALCGVRSGGRWRDRASPKAPSCRSIPT